MPEVGLIAATRGMLGVGIGLLAAGRLRRRRKAVGRALVTIGAIATVPLAMRLLKKDRWS